jgi:putative Mn2+ efflux pump MntP
MSWLIHALIIFALAIHVIPPGINVNVGHNRLQAIIATAIVVIIQVVMFGLGKLTGNAFLHLIGDWGKGVVFVIFFLISVRMAMEAFKLRKGEISLSLDNPKLMTLSGVAQGTNAFTVGMMFYYFPQVNFQTSLIALFLLSSFMIMPAIYTDKSKTSLTFVSLLYMIGALIMGVSAVLFLFKL